MRGDGGGHGPTWGSGGCEPAVPPALYPGTSETQVVVEVHRGNVKAEVGRLRSTVTAGEDSDATLLQERPPSSRMSCPPSFVVVARDRDGALAVDVAALDAEGATVGRTAGRADLRPQAEVRPQRILTRTCADATAHDDGRYGNAKEERVAGQCAPGALPCPASTFPCVRRTCKEEQQACTVSLTGK